MVIGWRDFHQVHPHEVDATQATKDFRGLSNQYAMLQVRV